MDHLGFGLINKLDSGKGKGKKPQKKTIYQVEREQKLAKQEIIESKLAAEQAEKDKLAAEINKIWLSPFNDAIWHSIGGE